MNPKIWPAEGETVTDEVSGVDVRLLTGYLGHSHPLYFTKSSWYDKGRRIAFVSDRHGSSNLFSVSLASGDISQHTDLPRQPQPYADDLARTAALSVDGVAGYAHGGQLHAVDLLSGERRAAASLPAGTRVAQLDFTGDGTRLVACVYEDLAGRLADPFRDRRAFAPYFEAKPHSAILVLNLASGELTTAYEAKRWLGHVDTSPAFFNLVLLWDEGPWDRIEQRLHLLDLSSGQAWPIREKLHPGERMGHATWMQDGLQIVYHGLRPNGNSFFGFVSHRGTDVLEHDTPEFTGHVFAHGRKLALSDGGPHIRLWPREGHGFGAPRILCAHASGGRPLRLNPCARFSPDGKTIVFARDTDGYSQLALAPLPALDELPVA